MQNIIIYYDIIFVKYVFTQKLFYSFQRMTHKKLVIVKIVDHFHIIRKTLPSCYTYILRDDKLISCQCLILLAEIKWWE